MTVRIHQQLTALAAIVLLLAAVTAPAMAQSTTTTTQHEVVIVGMVTGVLPATNSFVVVTPGGREVTVTAAPHNGTASTTASTGVESSVRLGDVRLLDMVWVRGTVIDHSNMAAATITILPRVEPGQQIDRQ